MKHKTDTTDNTENILELVNQSYQDAVHDYIAKVSQTIANYESDLPECIPYLRAAKAYAYQMADILIDHEIEDLEWAGSFIPNFDWLTLSNSMIDYDYDDNQEDEDYNCEMLYQDLEALKALGVIDNLEQIICDESMLVCNFNIIGVDTSSMQEFDANYKKLRGSVFNFYNY